MTGDLLVNSNHVCDRHHVVDDTIYGGSLQRNHEGGPSIPVEKPCIGWRILLGARRRALRRPGRGLATLTSLFLLRPLRRRRYRVEQVGPMGLFPLNYVLTGTELPALAITVPYTRIQVLSAYRTL